MNDELPSQISPPTRMSLGKRILVGVLGFLLVAFFLLVTQTLPAVILLLFHSLAGWDVQVYRLARIVKWDAGTLGLSLACLAAACLIFHRLRQSWTTAPSRVAVTIRIVAIVLCGAGSAIATSAVMHQAAWLSQKPVFYWIGHSNGTYPDARLKIGALLPDLDRYIAKHGRYPGKLTDLLPESPELNRTSLFYHTSLDSDSLQPVIYLRPQTPDDEPPNPDVIVLLAPHSRYYSTEVGCAGGMSFARSDRDIKEEHPDLALPSPDDP